VVATAFAVFLKYWRGTCNILCDNVLTVGRYVFDYLCEDITDLGTMTNESNRYQAM